MNKKELLELLTSDYEHYCKLDRRGVEGAIDVATGLFSAMHYAGQLDEGQEPTTAEKLLWLVEQGADIGYDHDEQEQLISILIKREARDFCYYDRETLHEAINAAYEWAQAEKAKEQD